MTQAQPLTHQWLQTEYQEQRYYWERGFFCLAQRPPYCDRGRFQAFLEARAIDDRAWSRYFFSEDNAKEEIALWLENWERLKAGGYRAPYPELEMAHDACWTLEGKDCTLTLRAITNDVAPGKFVGSVYVHPGREAFFTIDYPDLFPRFYFSQEIAIGELTAWMVCRNQVLMP